MPVPERPPLCLRRLTVFRDHSPLTRSCFCFLYFVSLVFYKPKLVFGFCQLTFRAGENPLLHVAAPERPGPRLCVRADGRIAPDRQPEPREHLTPRVCGVTADHATPHSRPHWPGVPLGLKETSQDLSDPAFSGPSLLLPFPLCLGPLFWKPSSTHHMAAMASAGSLLVLALPAPFSSLLSAIPLTGLSRPPYLRKQPLSLSVPLPARCFLTVLARSPMSAPLEDTLHTAGTLCYSRLHSHCQTTSWHGEHTQ